MKRRPFISSIAGLGALAGISWESMASVEEESLTPFTLPLMQGGSSELLTSLENEFIAFAWYKNGSFEVKDKVLQVTHTSALAALQEMEEIDRGLIWVRNTRDIQEQYIGRFAGEWKDTHAQFALLNEAGEKI